MREVDRIGEAIYGRHECGWIMWPLITESGTPAPEIIARALMARDERAAKIAREHTPNKHGDAPLAAHVTGRSIEAAILNYDRRQTE